MLKYRNIIILLICSLVLMSGLLVLNDVYLNIRINELKIYLQRSDRNVSRIDHIQLVMKYNINKKLYEGAITANKADALEFKIDTLTSEKVSYERVINEKYKYLSIPALFIINMNRSFIGKDPISEIQEDDSSSSMDIAYYYERNNYYQKALKYYDKALSTGDVDSMINGSIMLHKGFCHAMLGNYKKAQSLYLLIVKKYVGEEISVTATILLNYLKEVIDEQERVLNDEPDPIGRSKKLFNLFAYGKALEILNNYKGKAKPSAQAQILYYQARCYDELGLKEKSLDTHLKNIAGNPDSKYARYSNRRIYMIGSRLGKDNNIKEVSININKKLTDHVFEEMINSESSMKINTISDSLIDNIKIKDIKIDNKAVRLEELFSNVAGESIYLGKKISVSTNDGSLFIGLVIESAANYISIETSIGRVNLKRDGIVNIQLIEEY